MNKPAHFSVDPRVATILGENYSSSERALRELIAAIAETGMEYPEAHWYVIERYALSTKQAEALTRMYDDCGGIATAS